MDLQAIADALYPLWVLLFMGLFLSIVIWACWPSRKQKERMDDHARIPFRDEEGNGQPS